MRTSETARYTLYGYCVLCTPVTVRGTLYKPPVKDGRHIIGTAPELTASGPDSAGSATNSTTPHFLRKTVWYSMCAMPSTAPTSRPFPSSIEAALGSLRNSIHTWAHPLRYRGGRVAAGGSSSRVCPTCLCYRDPAFIVVVAARAWEGQRCRIAKAN